MASSTVYRHTFQLKVRERNGISCLMFEGKEFKSGSR